MIRRLTIAAYLRIVSASEPLAAWLLITSSHGDHLGHPFV